DKALLAFAREEEGAVAREVLAVEQVDLTAEVLESSLDLRAAGVGVVHDEGVVRIDGPVVIERCTAGLPRESKGDGTRPRRKAHVDRVGNPSTGAPQGIERVG